MNREFADLFHLTNYFDKEYGERIAYKFYKDGSVKSKTYHQFTMDINGAAFYLVYLKAIMWLYHVTHCFQKKN